MKPIPVNPWVRYASGTNGAQASANFLGCVQASITALRMRSGLSHNDLAARIGVTPRRLHNLLGTESQMSMENVGRIFETMLHNLLGTNSQMSVEDVGRIFEAMGEIPRLTGPLIDDALDFVEREDGVTVSTDASLL